MYYFNHVNSIMSYGIMCWGGSGTVIHVLSYQKLRTMTFKNRCFSCKRLFTDIEIVKVIFVGFLVLVLLRSEKL